MASPAQNSDNGGREREPLKQITFRFCSECSNMLYPKEDEEMHVLQFTCRTCQYTEEAKSSCVFRNVINSAQGETAGVTQDVGSDPTVGTDPSSSLSSSSTLSSSSPIGAAAGGLAVGAPMAAPVAAPVLCLMCGTAINCSVCDQPSTILMIVADEDEDGAGGGGGAMNPANPAGQAGQAGHTNQVTQPSLIRFQYHLPLDGHKIDEAQHQQAHDPMIERTVEELAQGFAEEIVDYAGWHAFPQVLFLPNTSTREMVDLLAQQAAADGPGSGYDADDEEESDPPASSTSSTSTTSSTDDDDAERRAGAGRSGSI